MLGELLMKKDLPMLMMNETAMDEAIITTVSVDEDHKELNSLVQQIEPLGKADVKGHSHHLNRTIIAQTAVFLQTLRYLTLLLCNVILWYLTNVFNGVAMQSYSKQIRSHEDTTETLSF
jgi:hypothetical protein